MILKPITQSGSICCAGVDIVYVKETPYFLLSEAFSPGLFWLCCPDFWRKEFLTQHCSWLLRHAVEILALESFSVIFPNFSSVHIAKQYLLYFLQFISNIVSQRPNIKTLDMFFGLFKIICVKIWDMTSRQFCKQFALSILNAMMSSSLLVWCFC